MSAKEKCRKPSSVFKKWEGKTQHFTPTPSKSSSFHVCHSLHCPTNGHQARNLDLPFSSVETAYFMENRQQLVIGSRWWNNPWTPPGEVVVITQWHPRRSLQLWAIGDSHQKDLSSTVPIQPNTGSSVGVLVSSRLMWNPCWRKDYRYLIVIVQLLSCVWLFSTPWTGDHQAPLSSTISRSLLKFISLESAHLGWPCMPWIITSSYTSPFTMTRLWSMIALCVLVNHVRLFAIPWTVAHQAPLSMEFSSQEYWSG